MSTCMSSSVERHVMGNTMTKGALQVYENQSALSETIRDEMARRVQIAALPLRPTDSVKARIVRAAMRLGISYQRAKAVWYRAARRIEAHEADLIRARTAHLGEIQQRMEAMDALLQQSGADDRQLSLDLGSRASDARGPRTA